MIVETPRGPARATLHLAERPVGGLMLGHGAGGGVAARDLLAATQAALDVGVSVALVEQPYRVAGKKSASPAAWLDESWTVMAAALRAGVFAGLPLVAGGRSSGARVACRTAAAVGASGVLCLAFPVRPVPRAGKPQQDRTPELELVEVPVLVVQGASDPFGVPGAAPGREVLVQKGTHALTGDLPGLGEAVRAWLPGALASGR